MSIFGRHISGRAVATLALLMVLVALLPALSSTPTREVTLVVRGMAFYLKDDPQTPNPTIDVQAGERVRIAAQLGQLDSAVAFFREALEQGWAYGIWHHTEQDLEPLRRYRPFQELLRPKG